MTTTTMIKLNKEDLEGLKNKPSFEGILDDDLAFFQFDDYGSSSYIGDTISEIADSCTSMYNAELWEHASDNQEYIERALEEGLVDTSNVDLIKIFQDGEYEYYTAALYENLDDLGKNYILDSILDIEIEMPDINTPHEEEKLYNLILDKIREEIEEIIYIDSNDTFGDLEEKAEEIVDNVQELINETYGI